MRRRRRGADRRAIGVAGVGDRGSRGRRRIAIAEAGDREGGDRERGEKEKVEDGDVGSFAVYPLGLLYFTDT